MKEQTLYANSSEYERLKQQRIDFQNRLSQLRDKGVSILLDYNVLTNKLYLFPFVKDSKIGFIDKKGYVIIDAEYDELNVNTCFEAVDDYVVVKKGNLWFIIDSKGNNVSNDGLGFHIVIPSLDSKFYCVQVKNYDNTRVFDAEKGCLVDGIEYPLINGFYRGYAKVGKNKKYGIIDTSGNVIVPLEYDNIWNHCGRTDLPSVHMEINGEIVAEFDFWNGKIIKK